MSSKLPTITDSGPGQGKSRVPAEVFAPGEFIREELDEPWLDPDGPCPDHGPSVRLVSDLVMGKKQITPETARGLAKAFGSDDAHLLDEFRQRLSPCQF